MIFITDGDPGSGKSVWLTKIGHLRWKNGQDIYANYNLYFSDTNENINKFIDFHEILQVSGGEKGGVIMVDEAYKIFDCRRFMSLPVEFSEKIAEHRHDGLDLMTATQNFSDLDKRVREKCGIWWHCKTIIRLPFRQNVRPFFQWTRVYERVRIVEKDRAVWRVQKKYNLFISKFWTKKLFDSYANLKLSKFLCRYIIKNQKPKLRIASREAINRGKARGF
jgi:hypothetical protein